ncbi:MAG: hypothetical protein AAGE52_36495, partial [Myxococcota bacterium]
VVATRTGRHTSACFSADGTRHASAWHKTVIEVRDATAGTLLATFDPAPTKKRKPEVRALVLSEDGRWAAGATGPTQVTLWDAVTGEVRAQFSKLEPPIQAIAFSQDAAELFVGTGLASEARCVSVFPAGR